MTALAKGKAVIIKLEGDYTEKCAVQ